MTARIDQYLPSLTKFNASSLVLASEANVCLRFPTGERFANQSTSHADLVALIDQVAPPDAAADIRAGARSSFPYQAGRQSYTITVEPKPGRWRVTIQPDGGAPPVARGPSAHTPNPSPSAYSAHPSMAASSHGSSGSTSMRAPAPLPVTPPALAPIEVNFAPEPAAAPAVERRRRSGGAHSSSPGAHSSSGGAHSSSAGRGLEEDGRQLRPIERMLARMHERGASDLHLSTGNAPKIRLHGEIQELAPEQGVIDAEAMMALLSPIIPAKNRAEFDERNDTDFAHSIPGVSRFRANMYRDRHGPGAVFRAIPFTILSPEQIGLPKGVLELCFLSKGLVVVTGPTGSGKSTTLATLIDFVNKNRKDHIITIEDPIEFVHDNKGCLVNQREVHTHTRSFKDALRAALREDPDIVLVGEMRDLETIAIAVETAETGHLVFGTLHTTTAPSTVDRIIDQFPSDRQEQIRQMLSESLRGVVAQTLCKKIGGGRVAAYEILLGSSAVSNLIRERKTFQLFSLMQTGRAQGMLTLNDSLLDLVKRKVVEPREAYIKAVNKAEFKNLLQREGFTLDLAGPAAG
jgi:twitching motility protein PilT